MQILVVNAGSSSLKLRIVDEGENLIAWDDLPRQEPSSLGAVLGNFLDDHPEVAAVGHRVVHGGPALTRPVLLDTRANEILAQLLDLAPLHNPSGIAAMTLLRALRPELPQVACFDTAFHSRLPARAQTYAVPRAWCDRWGIRRFGFHGLSHSWASRRAGELIGRPREELRLVTAHLGAGASLAAVSQGRSVDTTMGYTPMEGLVMATRSGTVDPGLVLWVQRHGLSNEAVEEALEHESGLRGMAGGSGDLREVIVRMDAGDPEARLAYDVYAYRVRTNIASMSAAMDGIDALVFTGGAGEASTRLRADTCRGLSFLGLEVEDAANREGPEDRILSPPARHPAVVVVHAREDLEIARHVRELLPSRP